MTSRTPPLSRASVLRLAWPVVLAQAATAMTGVVDTAVMGRFGTKEDLAAVAIASVSFSFIYWAFGFLRMSTTGLVAQASGQGDDSEVRAAGQRALLTGLLVGCVLLALFPLIKTIALAAFQGAQETEARAAGYFAARIWGAPAVLMGYALTGWMLGTGRTGLLLAFQIVMNGVNAGLDIWFVAGLDLGPTGIGAGTAIAEWVALAFGAALVWRHMARRGARLLDPDRLKALFAANGDILVRTLALLFAFAWFTNSGAGVGTAALAGNQVLLQFIAVSAFVLDAFAYIAEKEAGEAWGARDPDRLKRAMRLTTECALLSGVIFSVLYALVGDDIIRAFIADPEAQAAALAYLPWCAAIPLLGVAAWQLDGLFLGATRGRALRWAGLASTSGYIALDLLMAGPFGNAGVWTAFAVFYLFRAAALAAFLPALFRDLRQQPRQAR